MSVPVNYAASVRRSLMSTVSTFTVAVTVIAFISIVGAAILVPVYGDEVATRIMRGMFIVNGWRLNTLVPQCNPEYLRSVPFLLLPGALAYDVAYSGASPLAIRLGGMVVEAGWVVLGSAAILRQARRARTGWLWVGIFISLIGLGVLPLILVMARGEQVLMLFMALFIVYPTWAGKDTSGTSMWKSVVLLVGFCLLTSIFFYTHPKALFFFPVLMASGLMAFWARSRVLALLATCFVAMALWQSLQFAFALTQCPNAPMFSSMMASTTTQPGLAFSNPMGFLAEVVGNLVKAPQAIVDHLIFADAYQSGWLAPFPGLAASEGVYTINQAIRLISEAVFWGAAIATPLLFAWSAARRRLTGDIWLLAALWLGLFGHVALYKEWTFYASSLVMALAAWLLIMIVAGLDGASWRRVSGSLALMVAAPLMVLFVCSAGLIWAKVVPSMAIAAFPEQIGMPGQPISVPALGYGEQRDRIRNFAGQCGIRGDGAEHLVIDNLTLFAFEGLRAPLQSDYLNNSGFGVDYPGDALLGLLRKAGAKALVAQCTLLSKVLLPKVHRDGNLCCLVLDKTP